MLTALLLVASFALGPTPSPTVKDSAPSRPEAVAQLGAAQDPGFASWLAQEEGLPTGPAASGPAPAPAVTCSTCSACAAMHRSCCFSSVSQCNFCVPFGVKCPG